MKGKSDNEITRQAQWQRRMVDAGRCRQCAASADAGIFCRACRDKARAAKRNRYRTRAGIPLEAPLHSYFAGRPRAARR